MSKILVAGNDEVSSQVVSHALSGMHEITLATDGWTALELMYDEQPDAVMTDIDTTGLTGLGILAAAHAQDPMLPVVIISGAASLETAVEALRLGAYDYIVKPVSAEMVRTSIERALEARRLREENIRLVQDLRRANDFKAHLLRTVSHDFKNLLTVIKGYARLAQTVPDPALFPECLERILNSSRFMESLAEDLSTYGQIDSRNLVWEPVRFDLLDSIREAVQTVMVDPDQHVFALPTEAPKVFADPYRTAQILINLLGNAVKYSPTGGEIRVDVKQSNDLVRVTVSDQGLGIPEEDLRHLYKPFFRLERDRSSGVPGTGLGLTIVKNLVELQGGTIGVDSQEGKGTSFHFTLPAAE